MSPTHKYGSTFLEVSMFLIALSSLAVQAQAPSGPVWDGVGLWNLSNVNNSTLTFPSKTIAQFTDFEAPVFSGGNVVSLSSKLSWTVQSSLSLSMNVSALNYTNTNNAYAWLIALNWGTNYVQMGYGRDDAHSSPRGLHVGGECFLGDLTTVDLLGKWITTNITLSGPSQTAYFAAYDSNSTLLGKASTGNKCATITSFGTSPVNVIYTTGDGQADVDWLGVFNGNTLAMSDDFSNGHSTTSNVGGRPTSSIVRCAPSSLQVGLTTTCTVTVTDTGPGTSSTPSGKVYWTSSGTGTLNPTSCPLSGTGPTAACSVDYAPKVPGPVTITANYGGDTNVTGSIQTTTITVIGNNSMTNDVLMLELIGGVATAGVLTGALITVLVRRRKRTSPRLSRQRNRSDTPRKPMKKRVGKSTRA